MYDDRKAKKNKAVIEIMILDALSSQFSVKL